MDGRWLNGFRAASTGSGGGGGGGAQGSGGTVAAITATGADQAGAAAIQADTLFVRISAGAAGTGVRLPAAVAGRWLYLSEEFLNSSGEGALVRHLVYPATGETIRGLAANAAVSLYRWTTLLFFCAVNGTWEVAALPRFDGTYYYHNGIVGTGQILNTLSGINTYGAIQSFDGRIILAAGDGANRVLGADNLAEGLWFGEGTTRYINLRTSNSSERVEVKKHLLIDAGAQLVYTGAAPLTTAGTTIVVDWNNGNIQAIDLEGASGDVTLTLQNPYTPAPGVGRANYTIRVTQGAAARNLIWPSDVKWPGGIAPTISAANNAVDVIYLLWDAEAAIYCATFQQAFA